MQQLVIIGGGLSSRLLVIHFLKIVEDIPLKIIVIESNAPDRLGDAFCTNKDYHLLNVAAGKMSVYPEDANHFLDWLEQKGYRFEPRSFVSRKLYKTYVESTMRLSLQQKGANVRVEFLQNSVVDIDEGRNLVILEGGKSISAEKVILAIGNFPPSPLKLANNAYLEASGYCGNIWQNELLGHHRSSDTYLLVGTGLSMVDALLSLHDRGHEGQVIALSVHGYLPACHVPAKPYAIPCDDLLEAGTILEVFQFFRKHLRQARSMNLDWRAVVDSLRPFTQKIWVNLPVPEKKKFMQHLRHLWGVARHRMPPENATVVNSLLDNGRLKIVAGRISSIERLADERFLVEYRERHRTETRQIVVAGILNCMGPESNLNNTKSPLLTNMLSKGIIHTDSLTLGINCTVDGRILKKSGEASPFLYTIGAPLRGVLWESTAVPEIRQQAQRLAADIIFNLSMTIV
jgi:uncharacterized NAD(P)/FAD-binding protein YdhS